MILFYTTIDTKENAKILGDFLLKNRLVACYNILDSTSGYCWQGQECTANEHIVIMKTRDDLRSTVEFAIKENHSYELPCIIHWEVIANAAYERWVEEQTG